jgi:hypothetical protein
MEDTGIETGIPIVSPKEDQRSFPGADWCRWHSLQHLQSG